MKLVRFEITGMTCAICAGRVEKAIEALPGVTLAEVSLTGNFARVTFDETAVCEKDISSAVKDAGYAAFIKDPAAGDEKSKPPVKLIAGAVITLALMYISMGKMLGLPLPSALAADPALAAVTEAVLAYTAAALFYRFFYIGFRNLIKLSPTMDSLIAVGSGAALVYSTVITLLLVTGNADDGAAHGLYFESAAMILTLVSVGKLLEDRAKRKTRGALSSLLGMAPATAFVIREGIEVEIPVSGLLSGDIAVVRTGDSVPADGTIIDGEAYTDESALTGESMGVEKTPGSAVYAATLCKSGYFKFRVERSGEESSFGKIISLVESAAASKPPVSRLADRVSAVFVPAVMTVSLLSFIFWIIYTGAVLGAPDFPHALTCAVSVLVISCPCALGLATPTAVTAAVGRGASMGIFIKDASVIEKADRIDTVVFDKTGTLTEGQPGLSHTEAFGISDEEALALAAGVEQGSSHPLARALMLAFKEKGGAVPQVRSFEEHPGRGASATVNGRKIVCANRRMMEELSVDLSAAGTADKRYKSAMKVYLACDGCLGAVFSFSDFPKSEARSTVEALEKSGRRVIMLTGDGEEPARAVASIVGISDESIISGVLPDAKSEAVAALMKKGHLVAMVGDGINDAPALAASDIGIAMGAGRDAAIESADIVLLHSALSDVPRAFSLFRAAYRIIRENLFWALIYNVICIPIAAGVLYPLGILLSPMIAAAAMSFSSLFVVLNALRLNRFGKRRTN